MKRNFLRVSAIILLLSFFLCGCDIDSTTYVTPTATISQSVSATPTADITETQTEEPTQAPTEKPTEKPTAKPTEKPTPKPTEKPTAKPTEKPTAKPTEKPQSSTMVWVTSSGKKYHSSSSCSNMKSPYQISKQDAINSGRSACSKCY